MLKKNIAIVFSLTLLSKALGFFRDIALVNQFGATSQTDLFFAINSIIETIICFFGIQALFSSSTKLFSEVQSDPINRDRFFTSFSITVLLISIPLMIIIGSSSEFWIKFLYPGFSPEYQRQGAFLLKFFVVNIPILTFLRSFNSVLGVHGSFYLQNLLPAIINLVILFIIYTVNPDQITPALLIGITVMNIAFFLIQSIMIRNFGYHFSKVPFNSLLSVIKRVSELTGPLMVVTMSNSVFLIFTQYLASSCQNGTVTLLSLGSNLVFFSVGLVFMSILSVAFPSMAQLYENKNEDALKSLMQKLITTALFIFIPVSIFFICNSQSIIQGLFFGKSFSNESAALLSHIIEILSFAILPMVIYLLFNYLLQTYGKNNLIALCGILSFVISSIVVYYGYKMFGGHGIAIGLSTYHIIYAISILICTNRIISLRNYKNIVWHSLLITFISAITIICFNTIPFENSDLLPFNKMSLKYANQIVLILKSAGLLIAYALIFVSYRIFYPDNFISLKKR